MRKRIVIDPVTRIEGHSKITVDLDEAGAVARARLHVAEFRGFERFCVGRPFWEMPALTARVCGICPVSHLMSSAKAGDAILAVHIPETAILLRRICNLGQIIQSHALSFFHLSSPDLLFGFDSPPAERNVFGLLAKDPEFAKGGIRLRQFGQEVIRKLGGRKIHPSWGVAGGVLAPLSAEAHAEIRAALPEVKILAQNALERFKQLLDNWKQEIEVFGNFPSLFLGLVRPADGGWEHYDGHLRFVDADGTIVADALRADQYREFIGEAVESGSYLKSPYYRPLGYPDGVYRVGPLARLNVCERMGVPAGDRELNEYRERAGRIVSASFYFHYARLIEILAAIEWMDRHLDDPNVLNTRVKAAAGVNALRGVGCSEAPRGTLFHDYSIDETGILQSVNLVIATGQNNLAMNRTVEQIARHYIRGPEVAEGTLNRLEAGIRAFDPCLSCSTHAVGAMPLVLEVHSSSGELLRRIHRDV